MTPEDYKKLLGEGPLYQDQQILMPEDMYKTPLWHPGKIVNNDHYCMIHALNMYVGGALFNTAEKFGTLYAERTKIQKRFTKQSILLKGVSFLDVQNIIYQEDTKEWLSPKLVAMIRSDDIDEIIEFGDPLG